MKLLKYEFLKMDMADLKVATWIYENHPKALFDYLIARSKHYEAFDCNKAYAELLKFFQLK